MAGRALNTSTLTMIAEVGSLAALTGPFADNQLAAAISTYKVLAHQYIQLLDVVSNFAGPSLVPLGSPPVHVRRFDTALTTWNWTSGDDAGSAADLTGWSSSADPIDSNWRQVSSRAANAPSIFINRKIFGPITSLAVAPIVATTMQNGASSGAFSMHVGTSQAVGQSYHIRVTAVNRLRVQIFTGVARTASAVMTWKEFTEDVARPLMEAYQFAIERMHGRLKASDAGVGLRAELWAAVNTVTPEATRRMYEKLEVLRTPWGTPLYAPARAVHAARDVLVRGVVDAIAQFPKSALV